MSLLGSPVPWTAVLAWQRCSAPFGRVGSSPGESRMDSHGRTDSLAGIVPSISHVWTQLGGRAEGSPRGRCVQLKVLLNSALDLRRQRSQTSLVALLFPSLTCVSGLLGETWESAEGGRDFFSMTGPNPHSQPPEEAGWGSGRVSHLQGTFVLFQTHTTESPNGQGWKGPLGSPSPTPCPSRVTQSRLHSTTSRRGLKISRENRKWRNKAQKTSAKWVRWLRWLQLLLFIFLAQLSPKKLVPVTTTAIPAF